MRGSDTRGHGQDTSLCLSSPGGGHTLCTEYPLVTVLLRPAESDLNTAVPYGRNHSRILEGCLCICVPKLLCIIMTTGERRPGRDRESMNSRNTGHLR